MPDIAGNSSTTTTISVGGTLSDSLELTGDHDWVRLSLTAGQQVTITLSGLTLEDPYLRIRDSAGNVVYENDDINLGINLDSRISFTASTTGTYFIDIGAYADEGSGTYQLNVQPYTPPAVWTHDQVADQLINGYWGGDDHRFNVSQGGSLTVNLTALTGAGQALAREALALWSDIIGVSFVEVTVGGQMTFDDNEEGAFSQSNWAGGIISTSHVNVSTEWLTNYGTSLNGYAFQTYIHEIGHALGLGHAGNYNGTGDYFSEALYANDGWPTTIMSYFDQDQSSYFADRGYSFAYVVTPMTADVLAMSLLYGTSTTTRTGDTTYGFNSNAGRSVYNASQFPGVAYTIFDSGGVDTLDYSGFNQNQRIDLAPETFSNVGGLTGNVSIARGTVIENAIGGGGNDELRGNGANNVLEGRNGNDTLYGFGGNDTLIGGAGTDTVHGGAGNDLYIIEATVTATEGGYTVTGGDLVVENAGEGTDTIQNNSGGTIPANIENMVVTGTLDFSVFGNGLDNHITGNSGNNHIRGEGGNDTLDGGAGNDMLEGGAGNDTYILSGGNDTITEAPDGGIDTVVSTADYTLGMFVENLTLTGTAVAGTGNQSNNHIIGNGANNVLTGGGGADLLQGGTGNDTYHVDSSDLVVEAGGEGTDTVVSSGSFVLSDHVENLTLTGSAFINGTGNGLANTITGNSGNNVLNGFGGADVMIGGLGDDSYYVDAAGDVVTEGAAAGTDHVYASVTYILSSNVENLTLTGTANLSATGTNSANTIFGNAGNNVFNGGAGADIMVGGAGNDIYYIDDAGDRASEGVGGGTDRVYSPLDFVMWENVENLTLTGTGNTQATGNALDNEIIGNSGNNVINGGLGADVMLGGAGDDIYYVDNAGDRSAEGVGGGNDQVFSSVSFNMWDNIEKLTLTGTANLDATGNVQANIIIGNAGNNVINGAGGADQMLGGAGDDSYYVDNAADQALEAASQGTDRVYATVSFALTDNVEQLTLTGAAAINGTGNGQANSIFGNSAANTLNGGFGNDFLQGGGGADGFLFDTALDGVNNVDRLLDFSAIDDTIVLDQSVFSTLGLGALDAGALALGTAAADADDRIVYDAATGNLYYDADGSGAGAAILFAQLNAGTALTSLDFTVTA